MKETKKEKINRLKHDLRGQVNLIYTAKQLIDLSMDSEVIEKESIKKYTKTIEESAHTLLELLESFICLY